MINRNLVTGILVGVAFAATASATSSSDDPVKGASVVITGCVATDKDRAFFLTNVQEVSGPSTTTQSPTLDAMNIQGGTPGAIYWLSSDSVKRMRGHLGHTVEVSGVITDVSMGTKKVTQEPGKPGPDNDNKIEIKARGKESTLETEAAVVPGPAVTEKTEETTSMPVRRVKVDTVKMVSSTCK